MRKGEFAMKIQKILIAVLTLLWATSAAAETTISVFYAWPGHKRFHEPIAEQFMQKNPDIKVEFRAAAPNYDEAVQTLIRQSFAKQMPDIHFAGYGVMRQLVSRGLVKPLDPLMAQENMKALGYAEQVLALGQLDGKQVGISLTMSTPVVHYNADLVAKAGGDPDNLPSNWDDVIALAGRIAALGDDTAGMYYEMGQDDWMTQTLIMNHGGRMMTADGKDVAFDGPEGKAAVVLFRRFHDEGGQPAIDWRAARQLFSAGKLGMYFTSTSAVGSFEKQVGDKFVFRTAPLPLANPAKATMPTGGMAGVILTDDPAKQKAAWKYLLFATGPVGQTVVVNNTGYMPTNELAKGKEYLGEFYKKNPNWYTSVKQIPRARPTFAWPGENAVEIGRILVDNMTAIAQNQKKPEEALRDMASGTRALLPK